MRFTRLATRLLLPALLCLASCSRSSERGDAPSIIRLAEREPSRVDAGPEDGSSTRLAVSLDAGAWRAAPPARIVESEAPGALMARAAASPILLESGELAIEASAWAEILLEFRVAGAERAELYWRRRGEPGVNPKTRIPLDAAEPGEWRTTIIPRSLLKRWEGTITGFALRVPPRAGREEATLEVRSFVLRDETAAFEGSSWGTQHHEADHLSRPTLFARAPAVLEYAVRFPERGVFRAGVAPHPGDVSATFRVSLLADGGETVARQEVRADGGGRWREITLDIPSTLAKGTLRLEADGPPGSVALWANPILYSREASRRPSLIVYLVDCLRADRVGSYGRAAGRTPAFDRLAAESVTYMNAYANCTWTRPSLASVMTSYYPAGHGVRRLGDRLPGSFLTLAECLAAQGYQTVGFTANPNSGPAANLGQGFEQMYLRGTSREDEKYGDDLSRLREWIESGRDPDRPFLLFIHTIECHGPYTPPEPFASLYTPDGSPTMEPATLYDPTRAKRGRTSERDLRFLSGRFDGTVHLADRIFERSTELLREAGLYDNAYLLLIADHGESLGEHDEYGHDGPPGQEQIRVPFILRRPGGRDGGRLEPRPIQLVDLMPTALELLGVVPPPGAAIRPAGADAVFSEQTSLPTAVAVIRDQRKLVVRGGPGSESATLIDLATDPTEDRPTSPDAPELARLLTQWRTEQEAILARARTDQEAATVDAETEERLRALGYIR